MNDNASVDMEQVTPEQNSTMDLATAVNTVLARSEATNICVAIVNAFLQILQAREHPVFTQEEIDAIQAAVNIETQKTDQLLNDIEVTLTANNIQEEVTD